MRGFRFEDSLDFQLYSYGGSDDNVDNDHNDDNDDNNNNGDIMTMSILMIVLTITISDDIDDNDDNRYVYKFSRWVPIQMLQFALFVFLIRALR